LVISYWIMDDIQYSVLNSRNSFATKTPRHEEENLSFPFSNFRILAAA